MRHTNLLPVLILAACTAADSDSDVDSDTDVELPPLEPGFQAFEDLFPIDVTPDGRTVLVQVASSFEAEIRLIDTATGQQTTLTTLGDATQNFATGLSTDLQVSALYGVPVEAGVWTGTDWNHIESPFAAGCDINVGGAWDLSDDGAVAIGMMWDGCNPKAFRWTSDGVETLDALGSSNRATVVSGDGQVAAGFASYGYLDRSPAMWNSSGGQLLDPDTTDTPGEVLSINVDGTVLAGTQGSTGFRWTSAGMVDLGRPEGSLPEDQIYPNAMNADGSEIYGGAGNEFFSLPIAFVWSESEGSRALQAVAEADGIEIPEGWALTNVLGASNDGKVLIGTGYDPDGNRKTWILTR